MKKKIILLISFIAIIFFALGYSISKYNTRIVQSKGDKEMLSKFSKLEIGTDYEDIIKMFGEPLGDAGSGLPLLIYKVNEPASNNSTILKLQFTPNKKLSKISILDENGKDKKIILGDSNN